MTCDRDPIERWSRRARGAARRRGTSHACSILRKAPAWPWKTRSGSLKTSERTARRRVEPALDDYRQVRLLRTARVQLQSRELGDPCLSSGRRARAAAQPADARHDQPGEVLRQSGLALSFAVSRTARRVKRVGMPQPFGAACRTSAAQPGREHNPQGRGREAR